MRSMSLSNRSRARWINFASVGNNTCFGYTAVSVTRWVLEGYIARVLTATAKLSCNSAVSRPSPMRSTPPARLRRAVEGQVVAEELFAAEILEMRVIHPAERGDLFWKPITPERGPCSMP